MTDKSIKPMKLRSGEWGIRVAGFDNEIDKGSCVRVWTRESSYLAIVRNLVYSGYDEREQTVIALYGVNRIPDDNVCPLCGTALDIESMQVIDFGKPIWKEKLDFGETGGRPKAKTGFKKKRPVKLAEDSSESQSNGEDPDDKIPF